MTMSDLEDIYIETYKNIAHCQFLKPSSLKKQNIFTQCWEK